MLQAIINSLAINEDGVLVSGADNGSIWFWDYKSGNVFQEQETIAQPGSLESEQGATCCAVCRTRQGCLREGIISLLSVRLQLYLNLSLAIPQ